MKIVYSDKYEVNLGQHPFITAKFRLIKEKLIKDKLCTEEDFVSPLPIADEDILLVHTKKYLTKIKTIKLSFSELLQLEIPLTKEIVEASLICCGGTITACELALKHSTGIHIGGGFHHAYPDHGEGFCVFNDLAIAIRKLVNTKKIHRPLIVDCDLHQGNGTAYIFKHNPEVFTFSMQQEDIYPYPKEKSSLDLNLKPGTTDEEYLLLLEKYLPDVINKHKPDFILYQAGADPYQHDQLGSLALSINGLKARDKFIYNLAKENKIPIALTLGGGYAIDPADTVEIHTNSVKIFLGY